MPQVAGADAARTRVADSPLDRLARLAAHLAGAPLAGVSAVVGDEQQVRGRFGLPAAVNALPLAGSLCAQVIAAGAAQAATENAAELSVLAMATMAAVPLPTGAGVVWVANPAPRAWSTEAMAALSETAAIAERLLDPSTDTTEQREQHLRTAITDNATLALFLMDHRQHCTFMNPAAEQMTGYTLAEVQGRPLHETVHHTHPDGRPYALADCPIDRAFPTRRQEQGEEVFVHKDGHFYPVAFTASPLVEDGRVTGTIIEVADISARRESEDRYRALIDISPQMVWMSAPGGGLVYVNQYWLDFTGMTMADSLGEGWLRAIAPEDRTRVREELRAATARGEPLELELRVQRADGEYCWHLARGLPQRDAAGAISRWIGVATNIHGSKVIAGSLQYLTAASLRITAASGLEERLQVIAAEARGLFGARQAVASLAPSARWQEAMEATSGTEPAVEGGPAVSAPLVGRDGSRLGAIQISGARRDAFSANDQALLVQLAQLAAVAIENAWLLEEEQRARAAAERATASKNDLVSTISHDLKTPLTSIKGMAQLLRRHAATLTPETVSARLDSIDAAVLKMTGLLDELLDVARLEAGEPLTLNRGEHDLVVRIRALTAMHRSMHPSHDWRFVAHVPELTAEVDGPRLDRVLDNLLSNAAKYTPDGGTITVAVAAAGEDAVITVADNGAGIPAAALPRVFERFYRAANVARRVSGLGLGLAGARQLVEQHGGAITVTSAEGHGATFTIRLPRRAPAEPLD